MPTELHRLKERKEAVNRLRETRRNASTSFAIHYSCESFYDTVDGRTPRVTSIAVRNLASGQTVSFSIHKLAEQSGFGLSAIPQHYDQLERQMLDEFFDFMRDHPGCTVVHWNMRDINYGFPALEHRYKVLGGTPYQVPDRSKLDLARALVSIYSRSYIGHGEDGRFLNICRFNKVTNKDALTGAEEAAAFKDQQYVKLHQSTLRKVDMLTNLFERAEDNTLKTQARWREIYGLHPATAVNFVREHWLWSLFAMVAAIFGILIRLFK
jgi:hypothetical protein